MNSKELLEKAKQAYYNVQHKEYTKRSFIAGYLIGCAEQLEGIEHNNNWIKFESLNDINLFKDKERYFVFIKTSDCNEPQIAVFSNLYKFFTDVYNNEINNITHYQVIEKPKPPIY